MKTFATRLGAIMVGVGLAATSIAPASADGAVLVRVKEGLANTINKIECTKVAPDSVLKAVGIEKPAEGGTLTVADAQKLGDYYIGLKEEKLQETAKKARLTTAEVDSLKAYGKAVYAKRALDCQIISDPQGEIAKELEKNKPVEDSGFSSIFNALSSGLSS